MDCGCGKKNDCISKAYKKAHPKTKLTGTKLKIKAEKWSIKEKKTKIIIIKIIKQAREIKAGDWKKSLKFN